VGRQRSQYARDPSLRLKNGFARDDTIEKSALKIQTEHTVQCSGSNPLHSYAKPHFPAALLHLGNLPKVSPSRDDVLASEASLTRK